MPPPPPLSNALVQAAAEEGVGAPTGITVKEHTMLPGEGVTATVNGKKVFVGNRRLFDRIDMHKSLPDSQKTLSLRWDQEGGSVGFLGVKGKGIIASYCITDKIRESAKMSIQSLVDSGIDVSILTGDSEGAAWKVAKQVGLPKDRVHAELSPKEKFNFIPNLTKSKLESRFGLFRRQPKVLFCGDGVNDAPALVVADVGVSMGQGAALAIETSDVTLMNSDLSKLPHVIGMGGRVLSTIQENIIFTLACKLTAAGLTLAGRMILLSAVAADVGVLLVVTLNSLKLLPATTASCVISLRGKKGKGNGRRWR